MAGLTKASGRRVLLFVAIAILSAMVLSRTGSMFGDKDLVNWRTDIATELPKAETGAQPRVLYFTASWCPPCREMGQTTFSKEAMVKLLEDYQPLKIDIDAHDEIARKYGVSAVPTFVVLSGGKEIARASGYMDSTSMAEWLIRSRTQ